MYSFAPIVGSTGHRGRTGEQIKGNSKARMTRGRVPGHAHVLEPTSWAHTLSLVPQDSIELHQFIPQTSAKFENSM